MPWSALIGAGGSIIGGLLDNKKGKVIQPDKAAYQTIWGSAHAAREAGKAHGFNPMALLGLGAGAQGMVMPSGSGMGRAVADAGLLIADGMRAKSAEIKQIADLQEQNKELQKRLVDQTLRPPMGGMYQRGGPSIKPPEALPIGADGLPIAEVPIGGAASDEATAPPRNPLYLWEREFKPSMTSSDAEAFEARYGDLGGSLVGLPILGQDLFNHMRSPADEFRRWDAELNEAVSDFDKRWKEDDRRRERDKNTVKHDEHENRFKGGFKKPRPLW